jgi:transporter family-2 protein
MSAVMVFIALLGGVAVGTQSAINGTLGQKAGTIEATFVSLFTGAMLLAVITVFFGKGDLLAILDAPVWQLSAVFLAIIFVSLVVFSVRKIGVIATNILTIIGQLTTGLIIDHFGWFGSLQIPLDGKRLLAIVFMCLALYFIYKGNAKSNDAKEVQTSF